MHELVLASNNPKKLAELSALLEPLKITLISQAERGVPEADETGLSFVENAILKARNAAQYSGLPSLADDSGLCVAALNGAPGIFSARFAGPNASDADNNALLLDKLNGVADEARCFFLCALAFVSHRDDPTPLIVSARWDGHILHAPQGDQGFGYDPLFYLEAHQCSAAELEPALKNTLSHRGQALARLLPALRQHLCNSA